MDMTAYYNEIHPGKAETLRNMIAAGLIPAGDVDERSIEDVTPNDLAGYTQCHFFAGVGIWSMALRLTGWPDNRPVWTGSCPCQPFSSAGKGLGVDDERHLWPAWFHLICECRPAEVYAEQVASKDGLAWLDLVQADLEGTNYAGGFDDLCAAGFGAPHIRQRLYGHFRLADAHGGQPMQERPIQPGGEHRLQQESRSAEWKGSDRARTEPVRLDDSLGPRLEGHRGHGDVCGEPGRLIPIPAGPAAATGGADGLGNAGGAGSHARSLLGVHSREESAGSRDGKSERSGAAIRPGPTNGYWRDVDWLGCRDGKWRPVEPGSSPLAYGLPGSPSGLPAGIQGLAELAGLDAASLKRAKAFRKLALHSYGDGIVLQQAAEFIKCSQ